MLRRPALLCLATLLFATVPAAARKPAATAPAASATPKAPKKALLAAADEIVREVAALRGLQPKQPVARGVLSREAIGDKLKARLAKEYTPAEVLQESRVLKRLGLLPPDADYEKMIVDLLMEQVAGFYDPFSRKLYIADWLPLEMQRPALAHEIEHALQDQYFDLKRFAEPIKDDGDRQLARSALVEGDGTAVMLEFQAQAMGLPLDQLPELVAQLGKQMLKGGFGQTPLFDKAPAFLKQTLIFPYLDGLTFVEALRKNAPWSRIDQVFRDPPESTAQVMHPEKYLKHQHPRAVTVTPLASMAPAQPQRSDVLGELELRVLFESKLPEDVAAKAADGWAGDRLVAYDDPAHADALPAIVDLSAWDSETDAREAEAAARKLTAQLAGKPESAAGQPAFYTDASGAEWLVERHGDELLLLFGVPAGKHAAVAAEAWKSWKIAQPVR